MKNQNSSNAQEEEDREREPLLAPDENAPIIVDGISLRLNNQGVQAINDLLYRLQDSSGSVCGLQSIHDQLASVYKDWKETLSYRSQFSDDLFANGIVATADAKTQLRRSVLPAVPPPNPSVNTVNCCVNCNFCTIL